MRRAAEGVGGGLWAGGAEKAGGKLEMEHKFRQIQFITQALPLSKMPFKGDVGVEEGAAGGWITLCPYFQTSSVFLAGQHQSCLFFFGVFLAISKGFQKNKNQRVMNGVA